MADSYIAIDEPSVVDKKLDTEQITVGANTVERERFIISGQGASDFALPVAHDATDAGNPLKIGGRALSSAPADVSASGDRVNAYFDMKGRLKVDASDVAVPITDNGSTVSIDDGSGSITVDGTVTATIAAGATTIAKAEDAASADGDVGVPALAVRKATPANTSGADGDYEFLQMSAGRLWVDASGKTLTVDGSGVTQPVSDGGGALTVDGTVAVSNLPTTVDTNSGAKSASTLRVVLATDQPALSNKLLVTPDLPSGASTAAKQPALGTAGSASSDVLSVQGIASMTPIQVGDNSGSLTVDNAGTFAVQAASAGDVAHDGADSGNPVKVGGKATSSEPTAVASGDRANFITDLVGKLITLPYANPENFVSGAITSSMTGTTSTSLVAAPGSGLRNYITTIIVSNAHATVGTDVVIQDGSGGTTLLTIPAAAVYGGAVINLPVPLRQPTANTALYCANVTTGASTKVSAVGYKGA